MKLFLSTYIIIFLLICSSCNTSESENKNGKKESEIQLNEIINDPYSDLVGEFSDKEKGTAKIKIIKKDNKFYGSSIQKNKWSKEKVLKIIEPKDLRKIFGENYNDFIDAGLTAGMFAIFKVKKGYKLKNKEFKTGYFAMLLISGDDIYKL